MPFNCWPLHHPRWCALKNCNNLRQISYTYDMLFGKENTMEKRKNGIRHMMEMQGVADSKNKIWSTLVSSLKFWGSLRWIVNWVVGFKANCPLWDLGLRWEVKLMMSVLSTYIVSIDVVDEKSWKIKSRSMSNSYFLEQLRNPQKN